MQYVNEYHCLGQLVSFQSRQEVFQDEEKKRGGALYKYIFFHVVPYLGLTLLNLGLR